MAILWSSCAEEAPQTSVGPDHKPSEEQEVTLKIDTADLGANEFLMYEGDTFYVMKQYFLVMLNSGPNRDQDSATAAALQAAHMANIGRLADEGKIMVAGPTGGDTDLRGIFIFDAESQAEVDSLLLTDPAIAAGRMSTTVYPWWTAKGTTLK